jgi:FeS assembly SUF system regulator
MLRISKLADYATIIMVYCGRHPEQSFNAHVIADATNVSRPTVSKILKLLGKANLLISQRGTKGGYQLAKKPEQITMAEVIAAIDGRISLTECNHGQTHCELLSNCATQSSWQVINKAVFDALSQVSLAHMINAQFETKIHIAPPRFKVTTATKTL